MTSGHPRSADVGTLIDRYDAAWNAQDLDAIASMHDDAIVFHNHTAGERVAGAAQVMLMPKVTGSEDFSFYQHVVPGLFFFVGVTPPEIDPSQAYANHSPRFFADERGLEVGVRALASLAVDYLLSKAS